MTFARPRCQGIYRSTPCDPCQCELLAPHDGPCRPVEERAWVVPEEPAPVDGCEGIYGPDGKKHRHCGRCFASGETRATIARLERER